MFHRAFAQQNNYPYRSIRLPMTAFLFVCFYLCIDVIKQLLFQTKHCIECLDCLHRLEPRTETAEMEQALEALNAEKAES